MLEFCEMLFEVVWLVCVVGDGDMLVCVVLCNSCGFFSFVGFVDDECVVMLEVVFVVMLVFDL